MTPSNQRPRFTLAYFGTSVTLRAARPYEESERFPLARRLNEPDRPDKQPFRQRTKPPPPATPMFPSLPSFAAALSQPFKRSQLGLFHGKTKQYGNNVPFSKKKTRRSWLPNIQNKRLFSDALGENVRVKLTTRALKTIRKVCGSPPMFYHF